MSDRGMIKWQPFDSVTSSKKMVQHILKEKSKIPKPRMSEEQMQEIEENILEGYHNQLELTIVYFFKGRLKVKENVLISQVLTSQKIILCQDGTRLYFDQIIRVHD